MAQPPRYQHRDLKDEGLVEDGTEVLSLNFGLKFLLLVRQHVDFDVWVGRPADVHSREVLSLEDADYQLEEETNVSSVRPVKLLR